MEKNVKILVAEDEKIIGMDIKFTLEELGYNVLKVVDSGEKLLKILAEEQTDIVLMDIMLKGKFDGIQTAKLILEKFEIPVIYLTALTDDEIMESALSTQPFGYLLKPYDSKNLYSTIELALYNHKKEMEAKGKAKLLEEEKIKNDFLLGNIFPKKIVEELKKNGSAIPKYYEIGTILFSEFYNASYQNNFDADIQEKNEILSSFDNIVAAYGLERLKTIGNEIMVSGGIPDGFPNHVLRVIQASLKMQNFIDEFNYRSGSKWYLKTGINSGNVMAGSIGNKLSFDVWGDTVNIASRMKSTCIPNKINITAQTYKLAANYFNFKYRGKLNVKGKGEIDMYFVNSEKVHAKDLAF